MKFTEQKLEQVFTELLEQEGFPHHLGITVPRNKEIMRIYKDLNLVEQLGSGIPRILETYSKKCFTFTDNFIRMVFPATAAVFDTKDGKTSSGTIGGAIGGTIGGTMGDLTERQLAILTAIRQNPKVSIRLLSEQMKINQSALTKQINQLKSKKYISCQGGTRGYWKMRSLK